MQPSSPFKQLFRFGLVVLFSFPGKAAGPGVTYEVDRAGRWVAVRSSASPAFVKKDGLFMGWPPKGVDFDRWYRWDQVIVDASRTYGLDPVLVKAILWEESRFAVNAKSHKGATGIGQLMPNTARTLGVKDPMDPRECIWGTAAHLRRTADRFSTQNMVVLASGYNSGDESVAGALRRVKKEGDDRLLQFIPRNKETPNYVSKVLWTWDRIHRGLA